MRIVKLLNGNGEQVAPMTDSSAVKVGETMLSNKIGDNFLELRDMAQNKWWKIVVENGALRVVESRQGDAYSNALLIGNSITLHPLASYWWGKWGMAASDRDSDWVHHFANGLRARNHNARCYALNVADTFERDGQSDIAYIIGNTPDGAKDFDSVDLASIDLVIIRLGENGLARTPLENLIESIKSSCANNVKIIVTGMFWENTEREEILSSVAAEKECTFVSLSNASTYKSHIGAVVQGDDGETHVIDNGGVANHPSDEGMRIIANDLLQSIGYSPVE